MRFRGPGRQGERLLWDPMARGVRRSDFSRAKWATIERPSAGHAQAARRLRGECGRSRSADIVPNGIGGEAPSRMSAGRSGPHSQRS